LLQRSLERGRLAHAYLFTGPQLDELEALARTLAKTLNCRNPVRSAGSGEGASPRLGPAGDDPAHGTDATDPAIDSCDTCLDCRKVEHETHADVHWVRPESKTRVILVEQMRDLMREIHLKPTEAEYKVAVIVAEDRLRTEAANAFLKTLEEPPAKSVLILISTEPQRILETILSRCLRLNFAGGGARQRDRAAREWLARFSEAAAAEQKSLLGRYRLMDVVLQELAGNRARVEETLTARSPLQRYEDVERDLRDKWEKELAAAIEAEYRRQRADLLVALQWWLRDVWLRTLGPEAGGPRPETGSADPRRGLTDTLLAFPGTEATQRVARRISSREAMENLQVMEQTQRLLHTNVQEALALEVGLLKLRL